MKYLRWFLVLAFLFSAASFSRGQATNTPTDTPTNTPTNTPTVTPTASYTQTPRWPRGAANTPT